MKSQVLKKRSSVSNISSKRIHNTLLCCIILPLSSISYAGIVFQTGLWRVGAADICIKKPNGLSFQIIAKRVAKNFSGMSGDGPVLSGCKVLSHSENNDGYVLRLSCWQQYPGQKKFYTPFEMIVKFFDKNSFEKIEKYPPLGSGQKVMKFVDRYSFVSKKCPHYSHKYYPIVLPRGSTWIYP